MIPHVLLLIGLFGEYSFGTELAQNSHVMPNRQKRLVYGVGVMDGDRATFPAVEYQATIINGHYCNEQLMHILEREFSSQTLSFKWKIRTEYVRQLIINHCPISSSRAMCGGMAITENAIQTTCHCIARFDMKAHDNQNIWVGIPTVWNAWEDLVFSYVGAIAFDPANIPYASKEFIIHENCKQICNKSISHNFGIIVLRYRLIGGQKMAAPASMSELATMWYFIVEKQVVCLILGWGPEKFEGEDVFGLPSFLLRKSWQVVRSYQSCFDIHRTIDGFMPALNYQRYLYKEVQTWSCLTAFGKVSSRISPTDSGSPVTCVNDWNFAISNFAQVAFRENSNDTFTITTSSDLVFALYENSWVYRKSFNEYISGIKEKDIAPTFRPSLKPYQQTATPDEMKSDKLKPSQHGSTHSLSAFIVFAVTVLSILSIAFFPSF